MMLSAEDELRWQLIKEAAQALGIDADTLPSPEAPQPEPESEPLPELKIESLTDDEWSILEPAFLGHRRYLSKIPPRCYVDAVLWLAAYRFAFPLLPVTGEWTADAVRDKLARDSRAGVWSAVLMAAEASGQLSDERLRLLKRLVAYEAAAIGRAERLKVLKLKQIASGTVPVERRHKRAPRR
jgi:hypothetical protein